jgi:hypothetical protein
MLMSICQSRADTLVVVDGESSPTVVLIVKGRVVRRSEPTSVRERIPRQACLSNGKILTIQSRPTNAGRTEQAVVLRSLRDPASGQSPAVAVLPPILNRNTSLAFSNPLVAAEDSLIALGVPATGEIRLYSAAGKLLRSVRLPEGDNRVRESDVEALVQVAVAGGESASSAERVASAMRSAMRRNADAMRWPAFSQFIIGNGRLWIRSFRRTLVEPERWTSLSANGSVIGVLTIEAPSQWPTAPATPPRVVGFERDGTGHDIVIYMERDARGVGRFVSRVVEVER